MSCPKCGHNEPLRGPVYHAAGLFERKDSLMYSCARCGYIEHKPCKDANKDDLAKKLKELEEKHDGK